MKLAGLLLWFVGLAIAIGLIAAQGLSKVAAATAAAGWGILFLGSLQLLPMLADSTAWHQLLRGYAKVPLARLLWARWIGESVNNLVPTARLGGEMLRCWLAYRSGGVAGALVGASVVVDLTAIIAMQLLFTLTGLALLLLRETDPALLEGAAIGAGLLVAMFAFFVLAQRIGVFTVLQWLSAMVARRTGWSLIEFDAGAVERRIREFYGDRRRLAACALLHLAGWAAGTLEVWLGLWLLDRPVSFVDALMLESLVQAVRSAAFFMPGALGVQEGGLILLGASVGLVPEVALALSLLKRFRELMLGLPGLLTWQVAGLHRQLAPAEHPREP